MNIFPLVMLWFLTLGYVPEMGNRVATTGLNIKDTTTAQIGLSFETQDARFKVYTDMQSFQYAKSPTSFSPFRIDYSIGAQFNINDPSDTMSLHLNIDHECVHPVMSRNKLEYYYSEGITVLSLTIKGSTR